MSLHKVLTSPEDRFWAKVDKSGECWMWTGGKSTQGYGMINDSLSQRLAHRRSWEMAHGPIPAGLMVLHRCDVPGCVRPDHLFVGTQKDNVYDMFAKGRGFCFGRKLSTRSLCH